MMTSCLVRAASSLWRTSACRVAGCAVLVAMLSVPAPLPAAADPAEPLAVCWFYTYHWVVYHVTPNVSPITFYTDDGVGTGMLVTDGRQPNDHEIDAVTDAVVARLPRGDAAAPPPDALMSGMARIPCPPSIARLTADSAKLLLQQRDRPPGIEPETTAALPFAGFQ